MAQNIKKNIRKIKTKGYLAKDFDSFKADLLRYARVYFPDKIQDFSDASLGGLFLDMAAYVGDSLSFYLDHQFNELFPTSAVESNNILRHLRDAGVPITTVSPASCTVRFYVDIPAEGGSAPGAVQPQENALPIIKKDTAVKASNGTTFYLTQDLDFSLKNKSGRLKASQEILSVDSSGIPQSYRLSIPGICVSGKLNTERFRIPNVHIPFREITVQKTDVSSIINVTDSDGNVYYEVESLTQSNVFLQSDQFELVDDEKIYDLELMLAPRRFVKIVDPRSRLTTIRFGTGNAEGMDDDILPDPSELALPLYGKNNFSRFSIDPNSLVESQTLGMAPLDTTISVTYLHGGGLSHNVSAQTINSLTNLIISFPRSPVTSVIDEVKGSTWVSNPEPAAGGLPAPTMNELKDKIPAVRQMQSRIVSAEDLLARIYTLPAQFGRVFRAAIQPNPNNPLSTNLYLLSKDSENKLSNAPDSLKKNLRTYLNEFRLVSDAIDVLDGRVINFGVEFNITTATNTSSPLVIQDVINRLIEILDVKNFQINSPINLSDIANIILNTGGVISLVTQPRVFTRVGSVDDRKYSHAGFDIKAGSIKGLVIPPVGAIFELKYAEFDIIGNAS